MKKIYTLIVGCLLVTISTNAQVNPGCFQRTKTNYTITSGPQATALYKHAVSADFNNDGKMDIAAANLSNGIEIKLGNNTTTFMPTQEIPVGYLTKLFVTNVNNDNNKDLIATAYNPFSLINYIYVYTGLGNGTFSVQPWSSDYNGQDIRLVDVNNDNNIDIGYSISTTNLVFKLGNGTGTFAAPTFTTPSTTTHIFNDFNGDGNVDFLNANGSSFRKYHGNGAGSFSLFGSYTTGGNTLQFIRSSDLNADGILDVLTFDQSGPNALNCRVMLGTSTGSYSPSVLIGTTLSAVVFDIQFEDMNGDNYKDIIFVCQTAGNIYESTMAIKYGNGTGTNFSVQQVISAGLNEGSYSALADFNTDGRMDILSTLKGSTNNTEKLTLYLASPQPTVSVVPVNPVLCAGQTASLSITGNGSYVWLFNNSDNSVYMIGSSNTIAVTPSTTTNYTLVLNHDPGVGGSTNPLYNLCPYSAIAVVTQSVEVIPIISVNSGSICSGKSFTIAPSGASTYTFSSGSAVVTPTANSNYTVTGISAAGCNAIAAVSSVSVAVPSVTINTIMSNTTTLCSGSTAVLWLSGSFGAISSYSWSTGATTNTTSATPTTTTVYTLTIAGTEGCPTSKTFTQQVITCGTVGLKEIDNNSMISIYPNPANDFMTVSLGAESADATAIYVTNALGEMVLAEKVTSSNTTLNTSNLTSGIYFVKIESKNGSAIKKFIKQ